MSWQAVKAARAHRLGSPAYKAVLFVIAEHADEDGRGACPKIVTIAEDSDAGERTVRRAIKAMVKAGVLLVDDSAGRRGWAVNMQPVCMTAKPATMTAKPATVTTCRPATVTEEPATVTGPSKPPVTTSNHQPPYPPPSENGTDREFDEFWDTYPRRVAKQAALRAWQARLKGGVQPSELITAARHYAVVKHNTDERYVMYPATFLGRDERWRDHLRDPGLRLVSGEVYDERPTVYV